MSTSSKAVNGAKWTAISTIVFVIVSLLKIGVLARYLDASDFGLMSLVTFVLGFMNLFMDIGLTSAILHKQGITRNEYASLYWINVVFSICLLVFLNLISGSIADFYNEERLSYLISLMALSICFSAIGGQFKTVQQKELNFRFIAISEIIGAVSGLVLSIILAIYGFKVLSLIYSTLLQYLLTNLIFFFKGFRNQKFTHFSFKETVPFLKIGAFQVGGQIINYLNKDLDLLLIGKIFGVDVLGGYSLAKQLVLKPMSVVNPVVSRIGAPTLALYQNNILVLKEHYMKFYNVVSTVNFYSYFFLGIFAYPIVLFLYGEQFSGIVPIVQILCFYMYFRSLNSPVGSLVIATGKTHYEFYWNLLVLLIAPIPVLLGAQVSVFMITICMSLTMLLLSILSWKILIYKLIQVDGVEYLKTTLPNLSNFFTLLKRVF